MSTEMPLMSADFQRLYCDGALFDWFSLLHPISFTRVLPFQYPDEGVDDPELLRAEQAHLVDRNDFTRRAVVEEYSRCGLLQEAEARDLLGVIDFYDADFYDLMGLAYANTGRFRCALRWYRGLVRALETEQPDFSSDSEDVYASVGHCLYSLGLFEEAIAWSKACIGPRPVADAVCRVLLGYEAELGAGAVRVIERSGPRTRYTVAANDPYLAIQNTARLKATLKEFAPFQDVYIDWIRSDAATPGIAPASYPFNPEFDGSSFPRHKMNLIFATCGQADLLVERGYCREAKRLLFEAAMVEPEARMITERLSALTSAA